MVYINQVFKIKKKLFSFNDTSGLLDVTTNAVSQPEQHEINFRNALPPLSLSLSLTHTHTQTHSFTPMKTLKWYVSSVQEE
jgi:hypothetical protein